MPTIPRDPIAAKRLAESGPLGSLANAAYVVEQSTLKQPYSSPALDATVEAYLIAIEIEAFLTAQPTGGGRKQRGGNRAGDIFRAGLKVFGQAMGFVGGAAAVTAPQTTAALKELSDKLGGVPGAALKAADTAVAGTVKAASATIPTVAALGSAAAMLAGGSFIVNHPSVGVGIADLAARISLDVGDNLGLLGPSWTTLAVEMGAITQSAVDAGGKLVVTAASRPLLAGTIAFGLLTLYAQSKGVTASSLLAKMSVESARTAAAAAAAATKEAASAIGDTAALAMSDFNTWLDQRLIPAYDDLRALKEKIGAEMKERAEKAAEDAFAARKDNRMQTRAAEAAKTAAAAAKEAAPGVDSPKADSGSAGGRRLTSRRHHRRASAPRRTRRSSSGRRRGNSRRQRV